MTHRREVEPPFRAVVDWAGFAGLAAAVVRLPGRGPGVFTALAQAPAGFVPEAG
jgi:hypothetical protein